MRNFFRVATVVLLGATGVYIYELTGGEIAPVTKVREVAATAKPQPISRSPVARVKSHRTIDRSRPMPTRPAALDKMIEARGGSDFPVLIPQYFTRSEAMAKRYDVRLRLTDDGYTSVLTLPNYDVVIYGTLKAFRKSETIRAEKEAMQANAATTSNRTTGQKTDAEILAPVRRDYVMRFEDSDDGRGGSLSFGHYGVDYHIEFHCRGDKGGCIDAASANAFLAEMIEEKKAEKDREPRFRIEFGIDGLFRKQDRNETLDRKQGRTGQ